MAVERFTVGPDVPRGRLDALIAVTLDGTSRSAAQRLIRDGAVTVDGEPAMRSSNSVPVGAEVVVVLPRPTARGMPAAVAQEFVIAHENQDLLVVDKPAGLTVHPGPGHESDTLVNGLLALRPEIADVGEPSRPGIVHRLDRNTSGLLVVAKTARAYDALTAAIREHDVERVYTALVRGSPQPDAGVVDAPVGRDPRNRQRQAVVDGGRPARTRFRVVERLARTSLLEISLETGRMHQIRVHMASIGHPVCGDRNYGRAWPGPGGLERQFLHASRLTLAHPVTGEQLSITSPLPADLERSLEAARRE